MRSPPGLWTGQLLHFSALLILLGVIWAGWSTLGRPYPIAFWTATAFPVLHQIYVWLTWRLELRSSLISRTIGFRAYLILFFLLFGGRFVTLAWLGWHDWGSLNLTLLPHILLTILAAIPGIYAIASVKLYFGMTRAAGADHFDGRYLDMPFVNQGIFRFTSNGMYLYAFLLFWAIAIGSNSLAALVVAAFSHIYIWVHFYATEKPDMDYIYASRSAD